VNCTRNYVRNYSVLSAQERLLEDATKNNMHELVEHIQIYRQMVRTSLVPRPLPDFISQLWRKIGFFPQL